jgi:hypothetical protein
VPLLRQSIVDSHADLSNVVSSHFAVWLQQIPLEHQTRLGQQCNQFVVRHAFPFDLQTAHRRIPPYLVFLRLAIHHWWYGRAGRSTCADAKHGYHPGSGGGEEKAVGCCRGGACDKVRSGREL